MSQTKIDILERELKREKAARKEAEKILENKAIELYNSNKKLQILNKDLKSLLNRSDSQIKGVFENIIDAYLVMNLNGNILKMNKSALNLLGFKNKDIGYNLMGLVHFSDYEKVAISFKELLTKGSLSDFEISIKTKNNLHKILHINASVIYDKNIPVAAQGIIRDITSIKENELISEVINDITKSLLGTTDIYEITSNITGKIAAYLKTDDCVIYSVNHSENQMEQITVSGKKKDINGNIINPLKIEIGRGIVGTVAKTGKPELINDTTKDKRYVIDMCQNYSELTVPIIIENEVIGVIDSEHPEKNHFTKAQLKTLEKIAEIIGLKIKNAINLDEKERTRIRLLNSEKRLTTLISSLKSGILLEDENRKIVLTNYRFCDMFKIPVLPENMIGADCTNAAEQSKHFFENPDGFVERINTLLQGKETVIADELVMLSGKILERDFIPLYNNNVYSGHLWNYRDVTLKKYYSNSLESQKQKYSNIIANMNLGLLELDTDENILMCNQTFSKMSGFSEEEIIGKRANDIFLNEKSLSVFEHQKERRLEGYSDSYEIEIKNKTGETRIWLVSGAPNYNINGHIVGTISIHLDITEQKKLQLEKDKLVELLKIKNNELQEYAQIVSHDLKSPLRNISALTTWIKEDNINSLQKTSLKHFEHLEQTLERMEELITDILTYSSINSELVKNETFDLNKIIKDLNETLHTPTPVSIIIKEKIPPINGDKIKFQQLFQNLINNSIIHNDKHHVEIKIGYKLNENEIEFYVKDNGAGIDKKYHEQIFKIFYYVTKNKNSTGIGLSIVKKIIEIYEGKIWVTSQLGKGTTFHFTIKQ